MKARSPGRRRVAIAAAVAVAVAGLLLYLVFRQAPPPELASAAVVRGDVEQTVEATGVLKPSHLVSVGAQVSGRIETLHVALGDKVEAGDLIAEIDSRTQRNELQRAEAALRSARASRNASAANLRRNEQSLERQQRMLASEATSRADYEAAQAEVAATREQTVALEAEIAQRGTEVESARTNLEYTRITAPVAGTVLAVVSRQGQTVNAVQSAPTIVMLGNQDTMTVYAEISEADVVRTRLGQQVFFTILGDQARRYESTLRDIAPAPESIVNEDHAGMSAQAMSGSATKTAMYYNGLFDVDNADGQLRTYMTAQVNIVLGRAEDVLTIPSAALGERDRQGRYTVQVLDGQGRPQPRVIETGLDDQVQVEVRSGLEEGEQVVVGEPTGAAASSQAPPAAAGPAA